MGRADRVYPLALDAKDLIADHDPGQRLDDILQHLPAVYLDDLVDAVVPIAGLGGLKPCIIDAHTVR